MSDYIQKADQLAFHFYTKFFYTLHDARVTEGACAQAKTDKWFNLETPDCDLFTNDARMPYRAISLAPAPGPLVLDIQVLLVVPELPNDQVLVYAVPDMPSVKVEPARRFILLEAWTLGWTSTTDSLFSLLRVLPAWKLYKRLKRRTGGINRNGKLSIQLRRALPTETHTFPPVPHALGNFIMAPHTLLPHISSSWTSAKRSSSLRNPFCSTRISRLPANKAKGLTRRSSGPASASRSQARER
ncbi:hypothetical protein BJ912DRAFT_1061917 [Pholiota molesta]|nr:hypothetical protein BJ912DRAFT_1061917 [Pholiota molesta]